MSEEPCGQHCGYIGNGLDLWLHEVHEHVRCSECGREPIGVHAVSHKPDCRRLRPDCVYPGPVPAEYTED